MQSHNARLGAWLFLVYLLGYGAFVLVNAFAPGVMESTPLAGLNLAILSGFGLILLALALALVYGFTAKSGDDPRETGG